MKISPVELSSALSFAACGNPGFLLPAFDIIVTNWAIEWARDLNESLYRAQHRRAVAMRAEWAAKQSPKAS